jgi:hypothetical protein
MNTGSGISRKRTPLHTPPAKVNFERSKASFDFFRSISIHSLEIFPIFEDIDSPFGVLIIP